MPPRSASTGCFPACKPSGELDGIRYGIPYYGGVRIVVYKKSDFEKAGRRGPDDPRRARARSPASCRRTTPTTASTRPSTSRASTGTAPFPFVWDAGGDIAVQDGEEWTGTLDSAESRAGLNTLNDLVQNYSKAPKDGDETKNLDAFNTGNVGMMIDSWWAPDVLDAPEAKFAGDIGVFALPGSTTESTAPVFFGGSDLAVSAKSAQAGPGQPSGSRSSPTSRPRRSSPRRVASSPTRRARSSATRATSS